MNVVIEATTFECLANARAAGASDYIAIASAFIAFLALCATLYGGWLQRTHNRLSAKPLMEIDLYPEVDTLVLRNSGFGPALLVSLDAVFEQKTYDLFVASELQAFTERIIDGLVPSDDEQTLIDHTWMLLSKNTVISANTKMPLLHLEPDDSDDWQTIYDRLDATVLRVEYQSIYKQRDTAFLNNPSAVPPPSPAKAK